MTAARVMRRMWWWWIGDMRSPWVCLKWRVFERLAAHPDRCRARLASWPLGSDSLGGVLDDCLATSCREDAARQGTCWCGKFENHEITKDWPR